MPKCSFCSKSTKADDVKVMITVPEHYKKKSFICNNCVVACLRIIKEKINGLSKG